MYQPNGHKTPISSKQREALQWVDDHGTRPAVLESTWKSLFHRKLIETDIRTLRVQLTAAGKACLKEN